MTPTINTGRLLVGSGLGSWLMEYAAHSNPMNVGLWTARALLRSPQQVQRLALNGDSKAYLRELANKITAYRCFINADNRLASGVSGDWSYDELWTTEGLGYYLAAANIADLDADEPLLRNRSDGVSSNCLIPLHTGMGIWLAHLAIAGLKNDQINNLVVIRRFMEACHHHSVTGYAGAATEALGLLVGSTSRNLSHPLDRLLHEFDEDIVARFWHGVGRSLYFSAQNFFPCASLLWPAVSLAHKIPPHETGRQNALAGLAWAITLVNIRHPVVLASFLKRCDSGFDANAIANGIESALVIWHDWAPESDYLNQMGDIDRQSQTQSGHVVIRSVQDLEQTHGKLKRQSQLDQLFFYQPNHDG